ncbi:TIM barrel protein [Enterocloster sp.]|uniref:TIM barrel protein n=1 Tax=Enterocloster sp. TaxID=2719315 RepID=UPI0039A0441A
MRVWRLHWDDKQYEEVRRAARNQNIRILSACFSGHRRFPLGSSSRELEERGIRMMREGIDFCQNLGVRMLQVAGYDAL